jgi:hypothetical protein
MLIIQYLGCSGEPYWDCWKHKCIYLSETTLLELFISPLSIVSDLHFLEFEMWQPPNRLCDERFKYNILNSKPVWCQSLYCEYQRNSNSSVLEYVIFFKPFEFKRFDGTRNPSAHQIATSLFWTIQCKKQSYCIRAGLHICDSRILWQQSDENLCRLSVYIFDIEIFCQPTTGLVTYSLNIAL